MERLLRDPLLLRIAQDPSYVNDDVLELEISSESCQDLKTVWWFAKTGGPPVMDTQALSFPVFIVHHNSTWNY